MINADFVSGSMYRPGPETRVQIRSWSVREVDAFDVKSRHLCGVVDSDGRVCSPIQEFDPETMEATTRSGKIYEIVGWPGTDPDAEYVWSMWCRMNGIESKDFVDVTAEYVTK